jgi:hypothetical protein
VLAWKGGFELSSNTYLTSISAKANVGLASVHNNRQKAQTIH